MAQRGPKKDIDPEELMRRKFRAKCLFRALGRLCMANTFWLIEAIDEYEGVEDVKRRVEQAVRGKVKKQLLNVKDKALLNKPVAERTEHEKKYLYRIIGGLKCFKRYPNHVKRRLAAATYFQYYGPNRVVVREHQEAHALYFIVSGTVVVTQMIYDELIEEYVSTELGEMGPGDMFGEVSLLHNIPRTATVMTTDHCEFLQLLKEDFKRVLQTCVQKQWDEVKEAMKSFTYFDALDEVAFREGCIVAKMKEFAEHETILGDGVGVPNHVYFILYGRVQMIESLEIYVVKRLGKRFFTLFDPYVPPEPSEQDFDKYFAAYNIQDSEYGEAGEDSGDMPNRSSVSTQTRSRMSAAHARTQSILKQSGGSLIRRQTKTSIIEEGIEKTGSKIESKTDAEKTDAEKTDAEKNDAEKKDVETIDIAVGPDEPFPTKRTSFPEAMSALEREKSSEFTSATRHVTHSQLAIDQKKQSTTSAQGSRIFLATDEARASVRYSINPEEDLRSKLRGGKMKTFFMQVCIMNPGSTFGFGENMRDRRIVALTAVKCMLMPKIWLLQHNTANIWTRIQYYLEKKIPNKQKLFDEFTKQQEWEEYRKQVVEDVLSRSNTVNYTTVHDVPYSIRLEEMFGV